MPGGREGAWVDPRFRDKPIKRNKDLCAGLPGAAAAARPAIAGPSTVPATPGPLRAATSRSIPTRTSAIPSGAGTARPVRNLPCPQKTACPSRAAAGAAGTSGARKKTMTPYERQLEERIEKLRLACQTDAQKIAREHAAIERGFNQTKAAGARTAGAAPGRTVSSRNSALVEVNAQLAAQAANQGQTVTTRLEPIPGPSSGGLPATRVATKAPLRKRMTPKQQQTQEKIDRIRKAVEAGRAEALREEETKANREMVKALARSKGRAARAAEEAAAAASGEMVTVALPTTRPFAPATAVDDDSNANCAPKPAPTPAKYRRISSSSGLPRAGGIPQRPKIFPRPRAAGPARPPVASRAVLQTVILQPGEIDPTETTVITIHPPPSRLADLTTIAEERAEEINCVDSLPSTASASATTPSQPRRQPAAVAGMFLGDTHTRLAGAAPKCAPIPRSTACSTNIRSINARPISTNPNVSVLEDPINENDFLSDRDFAGMSAEDFHVVGHPFTTPRMTPAARQCAAEEMDYGSPAEVFAELERRKDEAGERQRRLNEEFLKKSKVMREEDPSRVADRILTSYYKATNPIFAECYKEEWDVGEVPVGDLINVGPSPPTGPEEFGPSARELLEAMREPQYGPLGTELLEEISCPQEYQQGSYGAELLENIEYLPTGNYEPGPFGAELEANVDWHPEEMPDPFSDQLLVGPLPRPPCRCPTNRENRDITDLMDW